jgi:hypothetical protein
MGVDSAYGVKKPRSAGKRWSKNPGMIGDKGFAPRRKPKPAAPGKNSGGKSILGDPGFFKPRKPPVKVLPGKAPGKRKPIKRSGRGL